MPIALEILSLELFGLWMLIVQINIVYQLIDLGFSEAFSRILIDSKEKGAGLYWETVKTAWVVFGIQALVILVSGLVISPFLPVWLKIPNHLHHLATVLIQIAVVNMAFSTSGRVFNQILVSNQRLDLDNRAGFFGIVISSVITCMALFGGFGIWSMIIGVLCSSFIIMFLRLLYVRKYCEFTFGVLRSPFNKTLFKEIFYYGISRFLATLGDRLLRVIPTFAITRILGLEATAAWGFIMRGISFCEIILCKPIDTAYPGLAHMYVTGDNDLLEKRYGQLVTMMSLGAAVVVVGIAICLDSALYIWSVGVIEISVRVNLMVAFWFGVLIMKRTLWPTITIPKKMGFANLSNLVDCGFLALLVYLLSGILVDLWALVGLLALATVGTTIPYIIFRSRSFPKRVRMSRVLRRYFPLLLGGAIALIFWFLYQSMNSPHALSTVLVTIFGCVIVLVGSINSNPILLEMTKSFLKIIKSKMV